MNKKYHNKITKMVNKTLKKGEELFLFRFQSLAIKSLLMDVYYDLRKFYLNDGYSFRAEGTDGTDNILTAIRVNTGIGYGIFFTIHKLSNYDPSEVQIKENTSIGNGDEFKW